ncbi:MAG: asparagine synthase (glutamine-hydrolyzing) [Dethiobacteria bacterium]|jgi:asparagine synthase (glutamine-hydrolysing)
MSGFCGIFQEHGLVDEQLITKMREKMHHRGPEGGKNFTCAHLGLGFRALKTPKTPDMPGDSQPLSNEDKNLWLVCNGKIYNYKSLRHTLMAKGHKFSTQSDSEVILHLYEEKGTECLKHLRGMFAFVLWDKNNQLLFGARDRFGHKPFYYLESPGHLAFASEIKALAELPFFPREVEESAFIDYLTFQYVPDPRTMFRGVYRLPPAHYFLKTPGRPLEINRYWQINFTPEHKPWEYFLEGIREKLKEAVALYLAGVTPRGAFLSSGVDSAIIAALARETGSLSTFCVGYHEENYSELQEARETAAFLETDHHEFIITPQDFINFLPQLVWQFDEPVADPAAISLFFAARLARQKVTAVLSGEGADEVFAGYGIYREPFALAPLRRLPRLLHRPLFLLEKILPAGLPGKNYLSRARRPLEERFLGNAFIFSAAEKKKITAVENNASPFRVTAPLYRQAAHLDEVTRMQYIDLQTWLPGDILAKADKMTMANSLELSSPYLDHQLFEFAATLPLEYKIQGKTTKRALREAFKDLLPAAAINRPKRGFPVPTREWIKRQNFQGLFRDLLAGGGGKWFQRDNVKKLFQNHLEDRIDASRKLWTILIFLLWHETFNLRS